MNDTKLCSWIALDYGGEISSLYLCDDLFYKMFLSAMGRIKYENERRAFAYNDLSSIIFVPHVPTLLLHSAFPSSLYRLSL